MEDTTKPPSPALSRAMWLFTAYLIGVILFGAWVRITGSGAGCGEHWPTCHGEIIPPAPSAKTLIEFTHRVTSGLCGVFGLGLLAWAWASRAHARRTAVAVSVTMAFIILESLLGAGLVLKSLVEDDDSVARAVVVSLHLINTLALVGSSALSAWWAGGAPPLRWDAPKRALLLAGLALTVLTCMTGAVTALGDTLFPTTPALGPGLLDKVRDELSPANHFLVRLRLIHPVVAMLAALALGWLAQHLRETTPRAKPWATALLAFVGLQTALGVVNIGLAAPGWMQLIHLLTANALWICVLLAAASAASDHSKPGITQ
jgi:cytochrome c oxidase assembly protein subunit 15